MEGARTMAAPRQPRNRVAPDVREPASASDVA
jgi:hypothetical protein